RERPELAAPDPSPPRRDPIPVTPAAHYMMGGIVTDLAGRSTVDRLYAVGEVSRTGVHGANRLASNSLLEGLVFAERAARDAITQRPLSRLPRVARWAVAPLDDRGAAEVAADEIRRVMWAHAAIVRDGVGLRKARRLLDGIRTRLAPGMTEELNMVDTAQLIVASALARRESRGGHYRRDFPKAVAAWKGRHIEWAR
ncbi:MAG: FAD-binding protein, partial [Gemmatimonadaceae bacterium]